MKIKSLIWTLLCSGMMAMLPLQVPAQMPMGGIPQFVPASSWEVSPTSLAQIRGLRGMKLPCMMMTQYDNGFIMRLSGGGSKLLAMAIDFRQSVFQQGKKYDAALKINSSYVERTKATAFSETVLIFNLRDIPTFYQGLRSAGTLGLEVEGNEMIFMLGGVDQGLESLENCYSGNMTSSTGVQQAMGIPKPTKWEDGDNTPMPMGASPVAPPVKLGIWEAKAGDDLKRTLERWANQAGVNLSWQAENSGSVASDIRVSGNFEEAVQTLMAQNAAALGLEANMMGGSDRMAPQPITPTHISGGVSSPPPMQPMNRAPMSAPHMGGASAPAPSMHSARWQASPGASLQQILHQWSQAAGVELVWQSNQMFSVKNAVHANGSYESALQALLNQFVNDGIRPAAQLNNDPVTGRRILFVESSRVL